MGEKEGLKSYKVADLQEFWKGEKHIELLDPNLLASEDCIELLQQVRESKAVVNFNQGLDIRFMTEEKVSLINEIKTSMVHFAWDNYEFKTYEKLKKYRSMFNKDVEG